jgi:hypothetical protein
VHSGTPPEVPYNGPSLGYTLLREGVVYHYTGYCGVVQRSCVPQPQRMLLLVALAVA